MCVCVCSFSVSSSCANSKGNNITVRFSAVQSQRVGISLHADNFTAGSRKEELYWVASSDGNGLSAVHRKTEECGVRDTECLCHSDICHSTLLGFRAIWDCFRKYRDPDFP